jgi:hypothetical protein
VSGAERLLNSIDPVSASLLTMACALAKPAGAKTKPKVRPQATHQGFIIRIFTIFTPYKIASASTPAWLKLSGLIG